MTICQVLDCIHNSRGESPECKLAKIEINDRCLCISFEMDHEYDRQQFRERHGYTQGGED